MAVESASNLQQKMVLDQGDEAQRSSDPPFLPLSEAIAFLCEYKNAIEIYHQDICQIQKEAANHKESHTCFSREKCFCHSKDVDDLEWEANRIFSKLRSRLVQFMENHRGIKLVQLPSDTC